MGCAKLPHYQEKVVDSLSEDFKDVSFDNIWISAVDSVMEMGYKISNMDKAGGFIYGEEPPGGFAWPQQSEAGGTLSVVIKNLDEKVTVKCQIQGGISDNLQKTLKRFFGILKNKLKV